MTEEAVLPRLSELLRRARNIIGAGKLLGWDVFDLETEVARLEAELADHIDDYMAGRLRLYHQATRRQR